MRERILPLKVGSGQLSEATIHDSNLEIVGFAFNDSRLT